MTRQPTDPRPTPRWVIVFLAVGAVVAVLVVVALLTGHGPGRHGAGGHVTGGHVTGAP